MLRSNIWVRLCLAKPSLSSSNWMLRACVCPNSGFRKLRARPLTSADADHACEPNALKSNAEIAEKTIRGIWLFVITRTMCYFSVINRCCNGCVNHLWMCEWFSHAHFYALSLMCVFGFSPDLKHIANIASMGHKSCSVNEKKRAVKSNRCRL